MLLKVSKKLKKQNKTSNNLNVKYAQPMMIMTNWKELPSQNSKTHKCSGKKYQNICIPENIWKIFRNSC